MSGAHDGTTEREEPVRVGVIGVGSMGQNHARVYRSLPSVTLAGVFDADADRARTVATDYGTQYRDLDDLLSTCDAVSIAVPTEYHYDIAMECIDANVDVLVEKPFVQDIENGRRLTEHASLNDVTLQVGHIERFNPAVQALFDLVSDIDVIAVEARRLGPPVDRQIDDTAVLDLMIHDIDILLSLFGDDVAHVDATGTDDANYATANVKFDSGVVGHLTASRVTQQKVRELTISARHCRVTVDYIDQTIEINRRSAPEFVRDDGSITHRHERVVEELSVGSYEPLQAELEAFVEAATTRTAPPVTGADGVRALELTTDIERLVTEDESKATPAVQ